MKVVSSSKLSIMFVSAGIKRCSKLCCPTNGLY